MPRRNPKNTSFGVFASSYSSGFLSAEDMQKHYYSPTYARDFVEKRLTEEDKSENMMHVHNVGKTYGKYMPFRRCPAPLLDRDSCMYNRDFNQKPNLQAEANNTAAEGNKPVRKKITKYSLADAKSKYSEDFPQLSAAQMSAARQPSIPDKGGRLHVMLGGRGPTFIKTSHTQTTHSGDFSQSFNPNGEIDHNLNVYRSNIPSQDYHGGDFSKTSYHHEFCGRNQRRKQAVGSLGRTMERCESAPAHASMMKTF